MGLFFFRSQGVVVALLLGGCGGETQEATNQPVPVTATAEAPRAETSGGGESSDFHLTPATYREGDRVVLPVVFTEGTRAELVYPPKLDIAALGVGPYSSGRLQGESPRPGRSDVVGRDFWIFFGNLDDVLVSLNGGKPPLLLGQNEGVNGQTVGFWDLGSDPGADYLGFQFGRWAVLVYDYAADGHLPGAAMTDAERASWATSFSGHETSEGFLLLEGAGSLLRLARAGEHAGPQLSFGSVEPSRSLTLYPGRCSPHRDQTRLVHGKLVEWGRGSADWCLSDSMRIQASGRDRFIDGLIRDLAVRNVALANR